MMSTIITPLEQPVGALLGLTPHEEIFRLQARGSGYEEQWHCTYKWFTMVRFPSSGGMPPERRLTSIWKRTMLVRFPSSGGIVPVNALLFTKL